MGKKWFFSMLMAAFLILGMNNSTQASQAKVYWDGLMMVKGQIGKLKVVKPINLWKRDGNKLVFERVLNPGEQYRVYRFDNKFGGQYGVGGGYYVTRIAGYVDYRTPSKKKLAELDAIYGKPSTPPQQKLSIGKVTEEESKALAPGLKQTELSVSSNRGPQKIYSVEYDGKSNNISMETGLAKGQIYGFETVYDQAKGADGEVLAGVNADYFNSSGHPVDLMIHKGDIVVTSQTPLNQLAVFGVKTDNKAVIGNPSLSINVRVNGQNEYAIDSVNRRRDANNLVLYNQYFSSSTRTNHLGTEVVVKIDSGQLNGHSVLTGTVSRVVTGVGNEKLNEGEFVLSGHHFASQYLQKIKAGDKIEVRAQFSSPEWNQVKEAVSGRYHLVRNGSIVSQTVAGVHPRTAIGIKADGGVLTVVVDGRDSKNSVGVTLSEMASIMKDLGAVQAFTFDGGGSSTLVSKDPNTNKLEVQNKPSDGRARSVANSFFFVNRSIMANSAATKQKPSTEQEAAADQTPAADQKEPAPSNPAPTGTVLLEGFEGNLAAGYSADGANYANIALAADSAVSKTGVSAKLSYDFTGTQGTSGAYIKAINPIKVEGLPKKIGMWIYGDGQGHWLRMQVRDSANQAHQIDFARNLDWTGWKYVEAEVPASIQTPFVIESPVRYIEIEDSNKNSGVIYVDDITAIYE